MPHLTAADIPSLSRLYEQRKLSVSPPGTPYFGATTGTTTTGTSSDSRGTPSLPAPSSSLNDRVGLIRGDITTLELDAIVNAANRSLLGGGGVDGAIHRRAGIRLYEECKTLGGCETGSAKITGGYDLPCRKVIHAVGPIYDPADHARSERLLTGCYTRSLELAAEHGCRTVAFSALSTGIYGYPSRDAAPAALGAIRAFLTGPRGDAIDKVVIVTFEMKDVEAYNEFIPHFFPPVLQPQPDTPIAADSPAPEPQQPPQDPAEAPAPSSTATDDDK